MNYATKKQILCICAMLMMISVSAEIENKTAFDELFDAILMHDYERVVECIEEYPQGINEWEFDLETRSLHSPFLLALVSDTQIFDLLLKKGGNPNLHFRNTEIPLFDSTIVMFAAMHRDPYPLQELLKAGGDSLSENFIGWNALNSAIYASLVRNADLIMQNLSDEELEKEKQKNGNNAYVFTAIDSENPLLLQKILDEGFRVDAECDDGTNAVEYLLTSPKYIARSAEMYQMLYDADPSLFKDRMLAVKYWSYEYDNGSKVSVIQRNICDIYNEKDENGESLITYLLRRTKGVIAKTSLINALESGANFAEFRFNGLDVIEYCESIGYTEEDLNSVKNIFFQKDSWHESVEIATVNKMKELGAKYGY